MTFKKLGAPDNVLELEEIKMYALVNVKRICLKLYKTE